MKPTFILTADWHLRLTNPISRTDDYLLAQERKIKFISDLQKKHNIPILLAGDLFDKAIPSFEMIHWCLKHLSDLDMILMPGNHDLPNHNINLLNKSAFGFIASYNLFKRSAFITRKDAVNITYTKRFGTNDVAKIYYFPYGSKLESPYGNTGKINIALAHEYVYKNRPDYVGMKAEKGSSLLTKIEGYDMILTGHNHKAFIVKRDGRLLVNPGSIMRMDADQVDHKPRVYLYYAETNDVEPVYLPVEEDVIDRNHLDSKKEKNDRMEAFITRMNDKHEISLSFENNLEVFFSNNRVSKKVKNYIYESIGD